MVKITAIASSTKCGDTAALAALVEAQISNFARWTVLQDTSPEAFLVSKVPEPECPAQLSSRVWRRWDRGSQLAAATASHLWITRSRELSHNESERTAVIVGCGISGMQTLDPAFQRLYRDGHTSLPPLTIPRAMPSAIASAVAETIGITGPAFTVSAACASGIHAIMLAKAMIDCGIVDRAVTGAVEVSLEAGPALAWRALRVLSDDPMLPFTDLTSGINLAEGAALMLLENESSASDWGEACAEIKAVHTTTGGGHLTRPDVSAMTALMQRTLEMARCSPVDISHLNSHGTGTLANNQCESEAIKNVFDKNNGFPEISATKAYHGHMLAASAALEIVLILEMMRKKMRIPILNDGDLTNPLFPRAHLRNSGNPLLVMKTAYGFGGSNGCLLLESES
jgi:nodulation protein E